MKGLDIVLSYGNCRVVSGGPTSSSVNLYAIWNIVTYKISYNLNDGILDNKISSYNINTNDIKLGIPKKEGYKFIGWSTEDSDEIIKDVIFITSLSLNFNSISKLFINYLL